MSPWKRVECPQWVGNRCMQIVQAIPLRQILRRGNNCPFIITSVFSISRTRVSPDFPSGLVSESWLRITQNSVVQGPTLAGSNPGGRRCIAHSTYRKATRMLDVLEPTQDPGWVLRYEAYNVLGESALESRFAFGNGFLGMRAARSVSRGTTVSRRRCRRACGANYGVTRQRQHAGSA